jgi:hypothetical protein
VNQPVQRWPGFGYVQVPGLANRYIARWLRTQRKNMRAFFVSHGHADLGIRMDAIKRSNAGMMEKNRKFQEVLDEYSRRATPQPAAEAADLEGEGTAGVAVPVDGDANAVGDAADPVRVDGGDAGAGVSEVAGQDSDAVVVEE